MSIDNLKEHTPIAFVKSMKKDKQLADEDIAYVADFDAFILTPVIKTIIMETIAVSLAKNLVDPYTILVPIHWFKIRPKNFTYPILFRGHKLYIVPYIREVLIYENE